MLDYASWLNENVKLFEEFTQQIYKLKKELPLDGGIMSVDEHEQLDILIEYFEKKNFVDGNSNENFSVRKWLEKDWNTPPGEKVYFQWVGHNGHYKPTNRNNMYIFFDTPKNIQDASEQGVVSYKFEDFFELKPEFRGHKLKTRYGI